MRRWNGMVLAGNRAIVSQMEHRKKNAKHIFTYVSLSWSPLKFLMSKKGSCTHYFIIGTAITEENDGTTQYYRKL